MKLAWISELGYEGYLNPNDINQRVDIVWQIALNTYHHPWLSVLEDPYKLENKYDAILFVVPKKNPIFIGHIMGIINNLETPFILVQEGPCWFWEEWDPLFQAQYLQLLQIVDGIFVHGESDKNFYEGLTGRKCFILPTMVNKDYLDKMQIKPLEEKEDILFVGGNATSWYNGQASASTANGNQKIKEVWFPSMGRKQPNEEILMSLITGKEIKYLPYMDWTNFVNILAKAKYAVHLMPASAAATFQLNCAILGIPCIGNQLADTQKILFPDLACEITDTKKAKELLNKLTNDSDFYNMVRTKALNSSNYFYTVNRIPDVIKNIEEIIHVSKTAHN